MKVTQGPLDPEEKKNYTLIWVTISAALMLGALWSLVDETVIRRPWKKFEKQFNKIEMKQLTTERDQEKKSLTEQSGEQIKELDQKIAAAAREKRGGDYGKLAHEVAKKEKVFKDLEQARSFAKADMDEVFYLLDHAKILGKSAADLAQLDARVKTQQARVDAAAQKAQAAEAEYNQVLAQQKAKDQALASAQDAREQLFAKVTDLDRKIQGVDERVIEIKQVVVDGLDKFGRVDRCETCHTAINRKGFEDQPNPFKTHPRLDDLIKAHPTEKFGCTSCHHGDGRALTSVFAAHAYKVVKKGDKEKGEKDEVEYKHHWEQPMYRGVFQESACKDCHGNQYQLDMSNTWAYANKLYVQLGCHGCHLIQGYEDLPKVGPDLRRVGNKLNPEWMVGWILKPTDYNPHTRMPNFRLSREEAVALAAFLLDNSEKGYSLPERYPGAGSIEAGKELVQTIGCRACHVVGEGRETFDAYRKKDRPVKDQGPDLNRVAEKFGAEWMYNWLKNPRALSPHTSMPSLRLTDWEVRNITSYVLSLSKPLAPDADLRQQIKRQEVIDAGKALVNKRGCYGCHLIAGFENAERIGPEITKFGIKDAHNELAFGWTLNKDAKVKVEPTWEDWTENKLKAPDVFDTDRAQALMPTFTWREGEVETLTAFLRGQDGITAKAPWFRERDTRWLAMDRGDRLVGQYNCTGCHIIKGRGGDIRAYYEGHENDAPPTLQGVGKKVQPLWLFNFLHRPTIVRPWLKIRMPSFQLKDEEYSALVRYFQAIDNIDIPYEDSLRKQPDLKSVQRGQALFNSDACLSCHVLTNVMPAGMPEAKRAALAPNLRIARDKLRADWMVEWMADPGALVPGTRMPGFWDAATVAYRDELESLKKDLAAAKTDDESHLIQKQIDDHKVRIQQAYDEIKAVRDYVLTLAQ